MSSSPHAHRPRLDRLAWALAPACALTPALPALHAVLTRPFGRFEMHGDFATLELQTRLVTTGGTLLGPYSRFGFNHPGPLYFYVLAPLYAAFESSRAMFLGPTLIAMGATLAMLVALRLAGLAHALAGAAVAIAWWAAFGSVVTIPWNPMVIAVPLVAFTVLAALVAAGRKEAALPAVLFGAFAAQTHLSCVPYVGALVVAAAVAYVLRVRRAPGALRSSRRQGALALGALVLTSLPPLIEQVLPSGGNLGKIAKLFVSRPESPKPWAEALGQLARVSAWLPQRVLAGALAKENIDPEPMWSAPFEAGAPLPSATFWTVAIALVALTAVLAWKRRDHVTLALYGASALGALTALFALRGIVGVPFRYLLFWATTPSVVAAIGIASALSAWAFDTPRFASAGRVVAIVGLLAAAYFARGLTAEAVALRGIGTLPRIAGLEPAYRALVARLDADRRVPVVHGGPGWHVSAGIQLELAKDGRPLMVTEGERWLFGRQYPAPPASNEGVVHVYVEHAPYPLETKPCLELAASAGEVKIFFARAERLVCPRP